ncbi:hypothetical protein BH20ACT3_BH20ACT3_03680 [soil metagenome]
MTADRYVVVGLAHVRSPWFSEVARWATAGALPVEFVKCLSLEELRARIGGGRPFSAALLDGRLSTVDRDLLADLADAGIPALVVEATDGTRHNNPEWTTLGAAASLRPPLERPALLDALATHGRLIGALEDDPSDIDIPVGGSAAWRGRLVAVTGRSGAGASTIAAAIAQRLADDPRYAGDVVLAELCRHAHQALLHDARDVVPGIQELVEAHRSGRPSGEALRRLTFDVPSRRYRLLLGLRRPRDWVAIRSRAFGASLDGLRRSSRVVVADTDADLEGESESGSFDVEDRNQMARTTTAEADLVVAVATPSSTGIHGLVGHLDVLRSHGVSGERILVVCNRAPRAARSRAELTRALASLTGAKDRPDPHVGPVYVTERRGVDRVHRDLARLPSGLTDPPGVAVADLLDRLPAREGTEAAVPVAVAPGSLGRWSDTGEEGG